MQVIEKEGQWLVVQVADSLQRRRMGQRIMNKMTQEATEMRGQSAEAAEGLPLQIPRYGKTRCAHCRKHVEHERSTRKFCSDACRQAAFRRRARRPYFAQLTGFEWYTPGEFIEAARAVMGSIDLDPASNDIAQTVVKASAYYTAENDGLAHEWNGTIWLNPPYARELVAKFVDKLLHELATGRVTQAMLLTNNSTDTEWFRRAASVASAICYSKRVRFWTPDGQKGSPASGQAFSYFGNRVEQFAAVFNPFGLISRNP